MLSKPKFSLIGIPGPHSPGRPGPFNKLKSGLYENFDILDSHPSDFTHSKTHFKPGKWLNSILKHSENDWLGLGMEESAWKPDTLLKIAKLCTRNPDINVIFLCPAKKPRNFEYEVEKGFPVRAYDTLFKKDLLLQSGLFHETLRYGWYQELFLRTRAMEHREVLYESLDKAHPDSTGTPGYPKLRLSPERMISGIKILFEHMNPQAAKLLIDRMLSEVRSAHFTYNDDSLHP